MRTNAPRLVLHLLVLLWLCIAAWPLHAAPRRVALLVGIGKFADSVVPALEGPAHDVAAVRTALQAHWGFEPADIEVLQDAAATRAGILAALQRLYTRTSEGDEVFVYFSGHGTSANDRNTGLPLPHTSGAFIPHDLRTDVTAQAMVEQLIVGQRDLRPLLARLDEGGRHVLVVSDSCYSGQAVRALAPRADGARLVPRAVTLKALAAPATAAAPAQRPVPPPYPYRRVFYIAAASDSETAMDIGSRDLRKLPTVDDKPHGALTDTLLRVLLGQLPADRNRDGAVDHAEAFAAIGAHMAARGYPHTPQSLPSAAEDPALLAHAPLFGMRPVGGPFAPAAPAPAAAASAPVAAAAEVKLLVEAGTTARDALQGLPGLAFVAAGQADFALQPAEGAWQLRGPAGDRVLQGTLPQVRQRLEAALLLRRLQQAVAGARQVFTLELQALPSTRGGSFVEGERFNLALRAQRRASVMLLNVDPQGAIQVLYPYAPAEKAPHAGGVTVQTPPAASPIVVTPPFGTDELLALAFEQPPPLWGELPHKGSLAPSGALLKAIEEALRQAPGGVAGASLLIRSLPRLP